MSVSDLDLRAAMPPVTITPEAAESFERQRIERESKSRTVPVDDPPTPSTLAASRGEGLSEATGFDDGEDLEPARVQGWRITSLSDVDRSLYRMGELEARKAQIAKIAADARARADEWEKKQTAGLDFALQTHAAKIEEYAHANRPTVMLGAKKGAVSRSLPNGRIGWRSKAAGYAVTDKAATLEWAKTLPVETGVVAYEPKLVKAALDGWCAKNPDVLPPGTEPTPGEEKFYVKPASDALALEE